MYKFVPARITAEQKAAAHGFYAAAAARVSGYESPEERDPVERDLMLAQRATWSAPAAPAANDVEAFVPREDQRVIADPAAFLKAGNATFTVVSNRTGKRFTFKARTVEGKPTFVSVLTGSDNEGDYTFLGSIFADGTYRHGKRSSIAATAPSATAWAWFYANLGSDKVSVYHEGRCCRCGRKLTVPSSVESGIGPECASKM